MDMGTHRTAKYVVSKAKTTRPMMCPLQSPKRPQCREKAKIKADGMPESIPWRC